MSNRDILIVGARRSGTTFTGKMMSLSKNISYLQEPFNYEKGLKKMNINGWYPYFKKDNINKKQKEILHKLFSLEKADFKVSLGDAKTDNFEYNVSKKKLIKNIFANYSQEHLLQRIGRLIIKNSTTSSFIKAKYNPWHKKLLVKDPLASLASNYLSKEFDLNVLVIVRHPAAFFESMKRKNWGVPPEDFLNQNELISDYLGEIAEKLKKANNRKEYAILEWLSVNTVLLNYLNKNNRFHVIKHEDICKNPVKTFKKLYSKFDIPFTEKIENKIKRKVNSNKCEAWRNRLDASEIQWVKSQTYDLAKEFYSDLEW